MPIIFITGYGDVPKTVQAMKAGAVEFLTKPFADDALLEAVATRSNGAEFSCPSGGVAGLKRTLCIPHASRTTGHETGCCRAFEQTGWWRARDQRDYSEGAPRKGDAENESRFSGGSGHNGCQAPDGSSCESITGRTLYCAPWNKVHRTLCPYVQYTLWWCPIRSSNRFVVVIPA